MFFIRKDDIVEEVAAQQDAVEDESPVLDEEQKINSQAEEKVLQKLGINSYEGWLYKKSSGFIVA